MSSFALTALIAAVLVYGALAWWTPAERPPDPALAAALGDAHSVPSSALVSQAHAAPTSPTFSGTLGPAEVSARVRLVQRLGRRGRLNDANVEVRELLARAPDFSARRWVNEAYEGVRREDEREADIRLLVSLGLPE